MYSTAKFFLILSLFACIHGDPTPFKPDISGQKWGWIDVRDKAHMFYWLHCAKRNASSKPLVLWLQGGPGGPGTSSTGMGNFAEIGPLYVNQSERHYPWTDHVNVLFVDSPVGTGYSYVENLRLIPKTVEEIANDMVQFFKGFYANVPSMNSSVVYIFGESYGGKMAVETAKALQIAKNTGKLIIKLGGVAMINPWISPVDSIAEWPDYLLHLGLIDQRGFKDLKKSCDELKSLIASNNLEKACSKRDSLELEIQGAANGVRFQNVLWKVSQFHEEFGKKKIIPQPDSFEELTTKIKNLMDGPVRKALNISSNIPYKIHSPAVFTALKEDSLKSGVATVEHLLKVTNMSVSIINGHLDLRNNVLGTLRWIDNLKWPGSPKWPTVHREPLMIDTKIEAYVTQLNELSFYTVIRAGQMVPMDNAKVALEILRKVTKV